MDVVDLLIKLLSSPSVTPEDAGTMDFIEEYLSEFDAVRIDEGGVKNIFLSIKFSEGDHLCFAGHVDVVPPGDGWFSDPFLPLIRDGRIYARGAQDMKSGLAAFVEAVRRAEKFTGRLSVLLTSDEEGDAEYGTKIVLRELEKEGMLPDYAVVAEPTCDKIFGDSIKIGRRGSINGVLRLRGRQGHAAYPEKASNPVDMIAPILGHIAGAELDSGDEFFAPSRVVITDIRAGMEATNVTPGELKMMFNVRNSTKTSESDIREFIEDCLGSLEYDLELKQSAKPFMTDPESRIVSAMDEAVREICGTIPAHSTAGGTSDARFFGEYGVKTIEFGPVNDTIHAPNENVPVEDVKKLYEVFRSLIERF